MRISIVTPSYNQGTFLEAAMRSVLDQPVNDLEYILVDGGSTDDSRVIIQRYAARLAHWQSESDNGQYDAITRGFTRSTGEIMGWLNSDDLLLPGALAVVEAIFTQHPDIAWLTTTRQARMDEAGRIVRIIAHPGFAKGSFRRGENLPESGAFATGYIQQESTFWRRSLWEKAGEQVGGNGFGLAGDFDLWARFYKHAELHAVETPLGAFRFHGAQKTGNHQTTYLTEARRVMAHHGIRRWSSSLRWLRKLAFHHARNGAAGLALRCGLVFKAPLVRHDRRDGVWKKTSTLA